MSVRARTLALLALAGCGGQTGTLDVTVVTAPGSDLLDRVVRVRATLSNPPTVVEGTVAGGVLALDLSVSGRGTVSTLALEGFDATGARIAVGQSPTLPIAAINASIAIYLAAPASLAEAPVPLDPPRSELGVAVLPYGVILAGGAAADGPSGALGIYNAYSHTVQVGADLPSPRAGLAAMSDDPTFVYLFGGRGADGQPLAELLRFETDVAPAGQYTTLASQAGLARAGADAVVIGSEQFIVTGTPPIGVDGLSAAAIAFTDGPPLAGRGAALKDLLGTAFFAGAGVGDAGAVRYQRNAFFSPLGPAELARTGHAVVALPDGRGLVIGGERDGALEPSAVVYDPTDDSFTVRTMLATPRRDLACAVAGNVLLCAGGANLAGDPFANAELFDARTLAPITTLPLVTPRTGAIAAPLATGQILIAGGLDAAGQPVAELELFTPDLP